MGLFGKKKICAICGGKVGLLGNKIANGEYVCSNCSSLCVPGYKNMSEMTADDVQANIDLAEANKQKGEEVFHSTRQFFTGADHDKPVIFVDEEHGWFMNAAKDDGWVYNLDDITYYNMRLSTSELDDEDKKGFLDWLFSPDFYSAYPELPQCPFNEKIVGIYLKLQLRENELAVDYVEFDLFPGLFTNEEDVRGAYECAHEFYQFMDERHVRQSSQFSAATAAAAAAAPAAPSTEDIADQLTKLHSLVQSGILTQEEFDAKKKQLLGI